jgi:hypothetical protein
VLTRLLKTLPILAALSLTAPGLHAASAQADFEASLKVESIFVAGTIEPTSADILGTRLAIPFDDFSDGNASTVSMGSPAIDPAIPLMVGEELSIEWTVMASSEAPFGTAFVGDDPFVSIEVFNTQNFAIDVVFVFETNLTGSAEVDFADAEAAFTEAFATGLVDFSDLAFDLLNFGDAGLGSAGPSSFSEMTGEIAITATIDPQQSAFADIFGGVTASAETIVPVPPAIWMFGSALLGLGAIRRRVARR